MQIPHTNLKDSMCIYCSTGVTPLQPWLWSTENKKYHHGPVVERGQVVHLGTQKGTAKWKLWIQTERQRYGHEDVTPLLHSVCVTAWRLTASSGDAGLARVLKRMAPFHLKWSLTTVLSSGVRAGPLIIHLFSVWIPVPLSWNLRLPGFCWMISQLTSEDSHAGRGQGVNSFTERSQFPGLLSHPLLLHR